MNYFTSTNEFMPRLGEIVDLSYNLDNQNELSLNASGPFIKEQLEAEGWFPASSIE